MKTFKKVIAVVLAVLTVCFAFAACSNGSSDKSDKSSKTDSAKIIESGKLVVGITEFAPMDYKDENGNWIGFDADLANMVAEKLGIKAEFTVVGF